MPRLHERGVNRNVSHDAMYQIPYLLQWARVPGLHERGVDRDAGRPDMSGWQCLQPGGRGTGLAPVYPEMG